MREIPSSLTSEQILRPDKVRCNRDQIKYKQNTHGRERQTSNVKSMPQGVHNNDVLCRHTSVSIFSREGRRRPGLDSPVPRTARSSFFSGHSICPLELSPGDRRTNSTTFKVVSIFMMCCICINTCDVVHQRQRVRGAVRLNNIFLSCCSNNCEIQP